MQHNYGGRPPPAQGMQQGPPPGHGGQAPFMLYMPQMAPQPMFNVSPMPMHMGAGYAQYPSMPPVNMAHLGQRPPPPQLGHNPPPAPLLLHRPMLPEGSLPQFRPQQFPQSGHSAPSQHSQHHPNHLVADARPPPGGEQQAGRVYASKKEREKAKRERKEARKLANMPFPVQTDDAQPRAPLDEAEARDVSAWVQERKSRFPTAANIAKKQKEAALLYASGGSEHSSRHDSSLFDVLQRQRNLGLLRSAGTEDLFRSMRGRGGHRGGRGGRGGGRGGRGGGRWSATWFAHPPTDSDQPASTAQPNGDAAQEDPALIYDGYDADIAAASAAAKEQKSSQHGSPMGTEAKEDAALVYDGYDADIAAASAAAKGQKSPQHEAPAGGEAKGDADVPGGGNAAPKKLTIDAAIVALEPCAAAMATHAPAAASTNVLARVSPTPAGTPSSAPEAPRGANAPEAPQARVASTGTPSASPQGAAQGLRPQIPPNGASAPGADPAGRIAGDESRPGTAATGADQAGAGDAAAAAGSSAGAPVQATEGTDPRLKALKSTSVAPPTAKRPREEASHGAPSQGQAPSAKRQTQCRGGQGNGAQGRQQGWQRDASVRPGLLERLVAPAVRQDRNLLLQVFRFLTENNFLQDLGKTPLKFPASAGQP